MVLYSGHKQYNAPHREGVALMLTQAQKALVAREAICPRIIQASFKTSNAKLGLKVIQSYDPTNDKEERIKEELYNLLQKVLDEGKGRNIRAPMGDFNAKIGRVKKGYKETMGKHGRGEMMANLCAKNAIVIAGSLFPHKRVHKAK
jgi:hypothetical protein